MPVIAKMVCKKNEALWNGSTEDGEPTVQEEIKLQAVYSEDPENPNHQWSKWTPSGSLHLSITNPDAHRFFKPGVEYTVEVRQHVPQRGARE